MKPWRVLGFKRQTNAELEVLGVFLCKELCERNTVSKIVVCKLGGVKIDLLQSWH